MTNEVYIKNFYELSLDELYEILRCRAVVFGVEQQIVYADPDNIDRLSKHFFVKTAEGIAAYLRLIPEGVKFDDAVSIGRVLTMSPWRRKGLSRLLLEKAIASARADGAERIRIEAQAYLADFYTSLGFVQTSQPYVLEGLMHIDMVKELTD